jgi:uncharacterized protein YfbU (UPF0304 family)
MTQQEIDQITVVMNETTTQLAQAIDKLDTQELIIKMQDEMIKLLKSNLQDRDKLITILESQLRIQDAALDRNSDNGKQLITD